ncbi:glutamate racemase [Ahrensia sp. R2A130]|uniref:glutamate racemase n=1 Tax=Ahrensia sp. R2A130 TaxID=744979 RepID=UPI0001E09BEA|nr:glutamate racemase [Ahrensia sp. R2A130]EFL90008.1 glutamate racemase [Ahrensia sp. R2A130]
MTVLVFDSGLGGLSVLREARILMPGHRFVYVADDAAFPYGDWEAEALVERMMEVFEDLVTRFEPSMIIVACNTASTIILPHLRSRFDFPVVGTVPAIKLAAELTASGHISVLATPGTVQRDYTRSLISEFASTVNVRLVGAEKMAGLAEHFMLTGETDTEAVKSEIEDCFVDQYGARTDVVVLACTHYPFLTNVYRRLAPWPVDWLNPAEAIARHAKSLLPDGDQPVKPIQDLAHFTGGKPDVLRQRLLSGFGLAIADAH